jgi:hypothetical protein
VIDDLFLCKLPGTAGDQLADVLMSRRLRQTWAQFHTEADRNNQLLRANSARTHQLRPSSDLILLVAQRTFSASPALGRLCTSQLRATALQNRGNPSLAFAR